jgi:aryl carrier-like protein
MSHVSHAGRNAFPVDPVEIVTALRSVLDVRVAVVTERSGADGRPSLVAYVTGPDPTLGSVWIRQQIAGLLPDYMLPEHIVVLDELPLTPAGDYDLTALPSPDATSGAQADHVAPRTAMEHRLAEIIRQLLDAERVGVHDNFFALGGTSILAARLAARIRETFGVDVSLQDVFAAPTIDEQAQLVMRGTEAPFLTTAGTS